MKRLFALTLLATLLLSGCYDPQLDEEPFVCGGSPGKGDCPDGYSCYGGICLSKEPVCYGEFFGTIAGGADHDYEPNNTPEFALLLECGDTPENTQGRCPVRFDMQRTLRNLAICPSGDLDIYKIYLQANEEIEIQLKADYALNRDLNMVLFHADDKGKYNLNNPDDRSTSTNHDEEITFSVVDTGWYYIMVYGRTLDDLNGYALSWILRNNATTE